MDELTQQNAALVEEATAASQSMAGQVRELNDMLARYELGAGSGARDAGQAGSAQPAAVAPRTVPGVTQSSARPQARRAGGADGEWIEA